MGGLPWSFHLERDPLAKIQFLSMFTPVQDWTDDIDFLPAMLVNHETYRPPLLFPDVKAAPPYTRDPSAFIEFKGEDGTRWRYRNMLLPMGEGLATISEDRSEIYDGSVKGRIWFTGPVVFPALTEMTPFGEETWMSVTPMEIFTCRDSVRIFNDYASRRRTQRGPKPLKKVVVAGLGLGWILQKMSALKSAKEIVVVEQSAGLLDWYGNKLCSETKKVVDVIQGDYWDVAEKLGPDYFHAIDIWPKIGQAYNDDESKLRALSRKNIDWWAWGYQFGEDMDYDMVLDEDDAMDKQFGEDEDDEDDED